MLVRVYGARDTLEAHFVRSLLEAEGIPASVQGDLLATARGELPMTQQTLPGLYVREEDVERAREVVRRFEDRQAWRLRKGPPWRCPGCQELIEAQFTQCWNCGHVREEEDETEDPQRHEGGRGKDV